MIRDRRDAPVYAYRKTATQKARAHPEADLQRAVLTYLSFALPRDQYRIRAAFEGARRGWSERNSAKSLGLAKGWPDLMILNRRTRAIRWIELKADRGRLTPEQAQIRADLRDHMAVCRSVEEVEGALITWGVTPTVPLAKANRYAID